jgi:hypothetical protein
MRSRHALSCFASLVAFALVGCGRTPLDVPEGDGAVAVDVPLDRPDTPPTDRPCMANADCNDNLVCNGEERCVGGFCQAGTPINCDDGVGCTVDLCDESTRACVNRPDNTRCTAPATCDPSRDCTAVPCTTAADCDDGDPCTGAESCAAGRCVRGVPLRCDDGVDCTADSCVPRVGCQSRADDTRCSDGVFCNGVETCGPRGCQRGAPLACGGTMCSPTRCDEATRACVPVSADRDGDGETPTACGGTDCDDNDRTVGRRAPEQCANGRDDNCDGRADCADLLCARAPNCGPCTPTGPEVCADGVDNDCNGAVDCVDAECRATPVCGMCVPTGPETGPVACGDGRDNDCDSRVDCASPGCAMEPRCFMCVPTGPEGAACVDGRDNDCNGQIDCADPACAMQPGCRADNDRCETAAPLLLPGAVSGNTTAARDDYMPGCAAEGGPDVAYVLRNPRTQTVTLDVESATFDAVLHVFRENCGGMALACNDDAVGLNPRLVLRDLAPGTYFVVVDGFGASRGSFRLRASVGTTEVCGNGQDDDGNGLVDCRDPACAMLPECRMCQPTGPEGGRGCLDGVDNDCNGRTDCDDPACASFPQCCRPERPEADPMACLDGRDNDCNGRVDCDDPGCAATGVCCMPTGPENTDAACSDGRDNDCDGRADCADPDCAGRGRCACVALPEQCGNGRDDDCDRLVDCADPDCAPDPVCTPMGPANDVCAGAAPLAVPATVRGMTVGARNDYTPVVMGFPGCGGGAGPDVVYAFTVLRATPLVVEVTGEGFDPVVYVRRGDCTGGPQTACNDDFQGLNSRATFTAAPGTYFVVVDGFGGGDQGAFTLRVSVGAPPAEVCDNRLDDDGDRLVDCADPDCAMNPACRCVPTGPENNPVACADGRDNDCDGLSDCAAPGCRLTPACCRPTAQREFGVAACTDGLDNDCDGVADCADSDCRPSREPDGECCNGRDDNGNTVIDEFACACETNAQCVGVGNGGPFPSNACWATTFRLCAPRCTLLGGDRFCREQFGPAARCDVNSGECR